MVFYDYDEVEYLTDCEFRAIPPAPTPEAELAEDVWYAVGPRDVFPEEFGPFLLGDERVRDSFLRHHADLLTPDFWRGSQERVGVGRDGGLLPVPEDVRFCRRFLT